MLTNDSSQSVTDLNNNNTKSKETFRIGIVVSMTKYNGNMYEAQNAPNLEYSIIIVKNCITRKNSRSQAAAEVLKIANQFSFKLTWFVTIIL